MTYEPRIDPATGQPVADETRVVERETYVERDAAVPTEPAGSQVNVNAGGAAAAPAYVEPAPGPLYYARRVVSLLFGILAVLLLLRILLLLLVANETNDIVNFIYNITEPFVAPFRGIFNFDQVTPGGGSVLDVAAVVALIGWALIYALIMAILRLGDRQAA